MSPSRLKDLLATAVPAHQAGDLARAENIYLQALKEFPGNPDAMHLLGVLAHQRGRNHQALGLILDAIDRHPKSVQYHANLGAVWMALGRYHRAADAYSAAIQLEPKDHQLRSGLGRALMRAGEPGPAAEAFQVAIDIKPDDAVAYGDLGVCRETLGDLGSAIEAYRKAIELAPHDAGLHSKLIFAMETHENSGPQAILAELKIWNARHAVPLRDRIKPLKRKPVQGRKLRVGFVSPDFKVNVVARCMLPVLREFNRKRFELYCYDSNDAHRDEMTSALRSSVDAWREIHSLGDDAAADLIRGDEIDVLFDLTLHCGRSRLTVFARRPAPVQVCYLGYPGSTGLETMDYRISHPILDPPGGDLSIYTEKTIYLNSSYLCYRPQGSVPAISPLPFGIHGFVTFGCLNSAPKVSAQSIDLWSRIMNAIPDSRLLLCIPSPNRRNWIWDRMNAAGIDPARVEIIDRQNWQNYLATWQRVDIGLDTSPYGAGVTASDALYVGVPMVTLRGERAVGRMCAGTLHIIGHPELVAGTSDEYVKLAVDLGQNPRQMQKYRTGLRGAIETSPAMNQAAIAQELQEILIKISSGIDTASGGL